MNHVRNAAFTLVIWELDGWVTIVSIDYGHSCGRPYPVYVIFPHDLFLNYVGPFCRIL